MGDAETLMVSPRVTLKDNPFRGCRVLGGTDLEVISVVSPPSGTHEDNGPQLPQCKGFSSAKGRKGKLFYWIPTVVPEGAENNKFYTYLILSSQQLIPFYTEGNWGSKWLIHPLRVNSGTSLLNWLSPYLSTGSWLTLLLWTFLSRCRVTKIFYTYNMELHLFWRKEGAPFSDLYTSAIWANSGPRVFHWPWLPDLLLVSDHDAYLHRPPLSTGAHAPLASWMRVWAGISGGGRNIWSLGWQDGEVRKAEAEDKTKEVEGWGQQNITVASPGKSNCFVLCIVWAFRVCWS